MVFYGLYLCIHRKSIILFFVFFHAWHLFYHVLLVSFSKYLLYYIHNLNIFNYIYLYYFVSNPFDNKSEVITRGVLVIQPWFPL